MSTGKLKGWLSSSSKLVAASAQLAKKQAELATLNNVTLPRLYHAIGKRLIGSSNLPPDLVPHREKIRELEAAIAKKTEEPKADPTAGFAAKAKHLAQQAASKTAKATADAAATVKIQAAYVSLGRQAVEKYGSKALPEDLRERHEAAVQKRSSLVASIADLSSVPRKTFLTPRRVALIGVAICALLALVVVRSAAGWLFDAPSPAAVGIMASRTEHTTRGQSISDDSPDEDPSHTIRENPLRSLVRVPRGKDRDPGWTVQTLHRTFRFQNLNNSSDLGRLLYAYKSGGIGIWQSNNGLIDSLEAYGLPNTDWRSQAAIPAWQGPGSEDPPFVDVGKDEKGTRVCLSPIEITDDLLCSVSFVVIDNSRSARAAPIDFLATQVELYGGKKFRLKSSDVIRNDTFVDFWSSTSHARYTVSRWRDNGGVGHITVQTYAPLLFEVLNRDPDFMFIENLKIALSPRFQKGCRELCDKVMELRTAQGQNNPPECRAP